ncbi:MULTISPECIES: hypothetical protein [Arthrobacter]|nr:hypothetical protein [Arthrobacter psychrochitiniphilus]NYG16334.1 membrane-bound ClpP family serine protease [Arthrobacter psychrochitiniphilus]
MLLSRTALLTLILSIGLLVGGALVVTFTALGILGWALLVVGIVAAIVAVTTSKPERLSEKAGTAQNQN